MSLTVSLTGTYSLPGAARSDLSGWIGWRNIFRTTIRDWSADGFAAGTALKIAAEVIGLLAVTAGLFSLFSGLSFL